jgi:hypothetical protein
VLFTDYNGEQSCTAGGSSFITGRCTLRTGLPIVHDTDAEREWACDRDLPVGRPDKALDEAPKAGWVVVDMKKDWKVIYPFEK